MVRSDVHVEVSAVVGDMVSEVKSDMVRVHGETKDEERVRADEEMNESSEVNHKRL